ncbi:MAG: hypothetical protein IPM42_17780 [Saprospiraceae bacterium]|nr:hypothetical protein [Saprospiraceae bacterium]
MSKKLNISLLIKISEEKYINELQKEGKFYCNSFKYFRELEHDRYKGDPNEGKQYIKQIDKLEFFLGDKRIAHANNAQLFPNKFHKGNVFCLYGFQTSNLDLTTKRLQKINLEIESDKLGQYALVIFNVPKIKKRLEEMLKQLNIDFLFSPVIYLNFTKYEGKLSPFIKSDIYQNQSEIRIWMPRETEEPYIFYH